MQIRTVLAYSLMAIALTACDGGSVVGLPDNSELIAGVEGGAESNTENEGEGDQLNGSSSDTELEEYLAFLDTLEGDELAKELAKGEPAFEIPPELGAAHPITENINLGRWNDLIDWPEIATGAANLPDGRVLTWSASFADDFGGTRNYTFGSIFDPVTETFTDMPNENHNNFCAGVAMLADGSVFTPGGGRTITTNSIFDGNSWNLSDPLNEPRWYPQSTTLPSGQVFTALGSRTTGVSELWTQDEGWELMPEANLESVRNDDTTSEASRWWFPALNVAPDGTLFHPGPTSELFSLDLYNNDSVITHYGKREENHSSRLYNTTVMYDIGKMLIAGGGEPAVNTAMTIDLNGSAPVITPIESMTYPRAMQNSVVLPNGKVLVIGGNSSGRQFSDVGTQLIPELWDPATGQWEELAPHRVPRNYHSTALLLKDGRVAAMGGGLCGDCNINQQNGEIFEPPYLFNEDGTPATRPQISSGPTNAIAGDTLSLVATPGMGSFSMVRLVALTHHHTTDQRYIPLDFFETSPGNYDVQLPSNANVLIPGNYWVFGLNADGVPSEGSTLMINPVVAEVGDLSAQEPVDIGAAQEMLSGVSYEYFEGVWTKLPNFDNLTPVAFGNQTDFSLSTAQRADNFAFKFTAELEITDAGAYTFFTQSDDGSQLFIDGDLVVNNDGLHAITEKQGSINLNAGTHEIVVTYFERAGGNTLNVTMEGPSIAKQNVQTFLVQTNNQGADGSVTQPEPSQGSAMPPAQPQPQTQTQPQPQPPAGLVAYEYFEGMWAALPNFDNLPPVSTGYQDDFSLAAAQQEDNFAYRFTASLEIAVAGDYTFFTRSDDGSQLFVNGNLVVDNNGLHGAIEKQGVINLTAGVHEIKVTYFERLGLNTLNVQMQGPLLAKQDVHAFLVLQPDLVTPPAQVQPPEPTVGAVAYEYYEGIWSKLPDFDSLTPVATGNQDDFSLATAQRADNFAYRFSASLNITDAGAYTFFTKSDDGSQLFIDGALVVDNDGLHGARERQGVVNLNAGTHDIVVTFFERTGLNNLDVQIQGPTMAKQPVQAFLNQSPSTVTPPPVQQPPNSTTDLVAYEYYEGVWANLPDFDSLTPVATGNQTDFSLATAQREDNFAYRFSASLNITDAGAYTFFTKSDDGSQLFINGNLVVDNDGLHGAKEKQGALNLSAGAHDVVVTFFERTGLNTLDVSIQGPSIVKQDIQPFIGSM